jgi:hypothetical protein
VIAAPPSQQSQQQQPQQQEQQSSPLKSMDPEQRKALGEALAAVAAFVGGRGGAHMSQD